MRAVEEEERVRKGNAGERYLFFFPSRLNRWRVANWTQLHTAEV